jgi:hypothetical protein
MPATKPPAPLPFADDHANYLYQRAEEELDLAQAADHPAAVQAHYALAGHYLDGAYGVAEAVPAPESTRYDQ